METLLILTTAWLPPMRHLKHLLLHYKLLFNLSLILIGFTFFLTVAPKAEAAVIRQEINLLDHATGSMVDPAGAPERSQLDTTQYNGSVTYYFEIVYSSGETGTASLRRNGTTTDDATINLAAVNNTRSRTSFTPPAGQTSYFVYSATGSMTELVQAARIIIIQDTSTSSLTTTETQIEIGNSETGRTNTTSSPLTNPKYWLYTAANWDGTKTFYAETTWVTSATNFTLTVTLQEDDGSFGTWSDLATIVNANTNTTVTRTRSASFTPTTGRHYRIASLQSSAAGGKNHSLYNAKIIVGQSDIAQSMTANGSPGRNDGFIYGSGGVTEAAGGEITAGSAITLKAVSFNLKKISSPTDNLYVVVRSTSMTGSILGTSQSVAGTSLSTSYGFIRFSFTSSISLSSSTTYYFQVFRDGTRDTSNYYALSQENTIASGSYWGEDNGVWSNTASQNIKFLLHSDSITKLEPQYLLLNKADSGSTGLQSYQQQWNASEWSGVSNVYKYAQDATNAADSSKLQDIDNGNSDITTSTQIPTGANQQIGTSFTMPTDTHQFDVNVTVTTGVVTAGRVLVATTVFGPLDHYAVTIVTPQTAGICATGTNTVTAQDTSNNTLTNDTSTVNMTNSGSSVTFYTASDCSSSTTSYTLSSGVANIYYKTNLAQSFTITATKNGSTETGTSSSITVDPGSHTRLVITLPSQTFTAGSGNSGSVDNQTATSQFTITAIRATDDYFNVITSYSGAKTLAYSGPTGSPTYTTAVSFTSGASTTALLTTLTAVETTTITVTDGGSYGYASSSLTVNSNTPPSRSEIQGGIEIRGGTSF